MKKLLGFLWILLVLGSVSFAGGTAENAEMLSDKVTLSFIHKFPEADRLPYFESIVKEYETAHPNVTIKMEALSDDMFQTKLQVLASGGNMPDIVFNWSGETAEKFYRAGALMNISKYLVEDPEWTNSFSGGMLDAVTSPTDEGIYAVPFRYAIEVVFYNKTMFQKYGLAVPRTWNEFMHICEVLKQNGELPIILSNQKPNNMSAHIVGYLNQQLVPEEIFKADQVAATGKFTDSGYVKSLQMFQSLQANGYVGKDVNSLSIAQAREMLFAGKGAMLWDQMHNALGRYEKNMPGQWGWFFFPPVEGAVGSSNMYLGDPEIFMVSSTCEYPDVAIDFLKYLTSEDNAVRLNKELGFTSAIKGTVSDVTSLPEIVEADKVIANSYGFIHWLDMVVDSRVWEAYRPNLQLLFEGKKAESIMYDVQKAAKIVSDEQ